MGDHKAARRGLSRSVMDFRRPFFPAPVQRSEPPTPDSRGESRDEAIERLARELRQNIRRGQG